MAFSFFFVTILIVCILYYSVNQSLYPVMFTVSQMDEEFCQDYSKAALLVVWALVAVWTFCRHMCHICDTSTQHNILLPRCPETFDCGHFNWVFNGAECTQSNQPNRSKRVVLLSWIWHHNILPQYIFLSFGALFTLTGCWFTRGAQGQTA